MFKTSYWSLFLLSPCKASVSVGWQKFGRGKRQSKELPFLPLYSDDPAFTSSWECWGWLSLRMQKLECVSNTQIHSLDQKMETFLCAPRPLLGRRDSDFVALPSHIFFCAFTDMLMYYRQEHVSFFGFTEIGIMLHKSIHKIAFVTRWYILCGNLPMLECVM